MAGNAKNTIKIKKYVDHIEERLAAAAVTPGMLVEFASTDKVQAHSTSDGAALKAFALEDELQGGTIDTAYTINTPVQVWICVPGEQVLAILADGENIAIGDMLVSNGNGYLKKREGASSGEVPGSLVAVAMEAVDTSDSSGGESSGALGYAKRIEVMVM